MWLFVGADEEAGISGLDLIPVAENWPTACGTQTLINHFRHPATSRGVGADTSLRRYDHRLELLRPLMFAIKIRPFCPNNTMSFARLIGIHRLTFC
jgi:hypothetical protein